MISGLLSEQSEKRQLLEWQRGQPHTGGRGRAGYSAAHSATCDPLQMCTEEESVCFCPEGDNIYTDKMMCVGRHVANSQVQCELYVLLWTWHILLLHLRDMLETLWRKPCSIIFDPLFYPDSSLLSWASLNINVPNSFRSHVRIPLRGWEQ